MTHMMTELVVLSVCVCRCSIYSEKKSGKIYLVEPILNYMKTNQMYVLYCIYMVFPKDGQYKQFDKI